MDSISANPAGPDEVTPLTDHSVVAGLLRRDRKAAAELLYSHADTIYTYLFFRLTPRTGMLEDLFQDVFISAWQSLDNYRGRASLKSWLLGIARHKVEDYYRSCLQQYDLEVDDEPATAPLFDEKIDSQRRHELVHQILQELPEPYRVALLWRYWEHRSAREMAEMSGRTEKAVERLLARARESFKERWNRA